MVERLRSVDIRIVIDTNKATYEKSFDNLPDAMDFYTAHIGEFMPERAEKLRQLADKVKTVLGN